MKKKLIIFDLDGVIFDSKLNMKASWGEVKKKFNLKISFKNYFSKIGAPFEDILKLLKFKNDIKLAKKIYRETSINKFNLIKLYPGVKKTINYLLKNKKLYKIAIITSKEKTRSNKLLKKFNLKFDYVQCPSKNLRGKPYPDLLNKVIGKFNIKKNYVFYVGDTYIDYKFAKDSKINFIYCKYGYGKLRLKNLNIINTLFQIFRYIKDDK